MLKISLFEEYLVNILNDFKSLDSGELADYIPELANVKPDLFGISLATIDGHIYQVGDTHHDFTIQSISKAFVYGIALEDNGVEEVTRKVDIEPSGEAFNSISLDPESGRPKNAMINAGAIATTGLVAGANSDIKIQRILEVFSKYTGHDLKIDNDVYKSESSTGHRNKAIAYLLRNSSIIERNPDDIVDAYFKQCSILINCRDLSLMGATLANSGVNPITGIRALKEELVPKVLSLMTSCGMYDYSGAWLFNVGMPAKSGVGGGIIAVLPGQIGLAVFSPKLDSKGNSVRGLAVCNKISNDFSLHMLRMSTLTQSSVIRNKYFATKIRSKRIRRFDEINVLDKVGKEILVFELTGDLTFVTSEIISNEVSKEINNFSYLIFDFLRISSIDQAAFQIIVDLINKLISDDVKVIFTNILDKYGLLRELRNKIGTNENRNFLSIKNIDLALEHCEDELLLNFGLGNNLVYVPFEQQDIVEGLNNEEIEYLKSKVVYKEYKPGEYIVEEGEDATLIYFLLSGQVSVVLSDSKYTSQRIAVLNSGTAFGELSMVDRGIRSASIIADEDVKCCALDYVVLENDQSSIAKTTNLKMLKNVAKVLSDRLRRTNEVVKSLS